MPKGAKFGGRKKGSGNRLTVSMKDTVEATLKFLQSKSGVSMRDWAMKNPTEFYRIAAKLIPTQITDADGKGFNITVTLKK